MAKGIRRGAGGASGGAAGMTYVQYWVDEGKSYIEWVNHGDTVLSPTSFTPSKTGYTFLGWKESRVADGDVLVTKVAEKQFLTLYAVFYKTITITYYNDSSTASTNNQRLYYNNTDINLAKFTLTQATRSTWTPRGWSESNAGGDSLIIYQNATQFERDSNITLYGCYERTVTLSYNANGGTGTVSGDSGTAYHHSISGDINASFILKDNEFEKTDYQFIQWRAKSASGTAYQPYAVYETCTDDTIYADWMVLSTLVRYNVDVNTYYEEWVPRGSSVLSPSSFTPTKTGYTFLGWKDSGIASSDVLVTKTASGEKMSLYAVFTKTITLTTYNASTTATIVTSPYYYNNMDYLAPKFTLSENTSSGWTKIGWTNINDGYTSIIADGTEIELGESATFYSLYSQSITLTTYNASNTATTDTKIRYVNYHNTAAYSNPSWTLTEIAISGWTNAGWTNKTNGYSATVADGGTVTLDASAAYYTLYSRTITLTQYNASNSPTYQYGTQVANIHSATTTSNPSFTLTEGALSGWNKAGWTNSTSGYSATVADGGTVTLSANATYYSLFTQQLSCSVHCSTRSAWGGWVTDYGNRVANVHNTTSIQNPTFGPYTEYDLNSPIGMTGWVGRGFTTSTSGGASGVTVSNGGSITTASSLTLYAMYYRTVTLSYNGNGASGGSTTAGTGTAYYHTNSGATNAAITIASNGYTRSGYNFVQWRLNGASGTAYAPGSTYTSYADATMYAEWKIKEATKDITNDPNYVSGTLRVDGDIRWTNQEFHNTFNILSMGDYQTCTVTVQVRCETESGGSGSCCCSCGVDDTASYNHGNIVAWGGKGTTYTGSVNVGIGMHTLSLWLWAEQRNVGYAIITKIELSNPK